MLQGDSALRHLFLSAHLPFPDKKTHRRAEERFLRKGSTCAFVSASVMEATVNYKSKAPGLPGSYNWRNDQQSKKKKIWFKFAKLESVF